MGIERPVRQAGGLHHFAHAYVLKSPFAEQAGNLLSQCARVSRRSLWRDSA
jgi:hypothetical protein